MTSSQHIESTADDESTSESVVCLGSYNLSKMGDKRFVTFVTETLECKFGVRIWCFQECQQLSSSTEVLGYLLYKQSGNATAVLIPKHGQHLSLGFSLSDVAQL